MSISAAVTAGRGVDDAVSVTRWRLPLLIPLLVGIALILVALLGPTDRNKYLLTAIGVLVGLITLGKSFVPARAELGLDELTDLLALAMRNQWTKAAVDRRLLHPAPLPIRWCRSTEPVAGPAEAATLARTDHTFIDPLPGLTRITSNRLHHGARRDLHRIYGGLASGRLLIIGGPGTGKSSAAVLLLLDALTYRDQATPAERSRIPVPVLFTLHNWDPATTSVEDWLSTKLTEIPLFRGRRGKHHATTLLRAGRIAVFLDGLDEISSQTQPLALQALSEQATFRLVLLTRTAELATAAQHHGLVGAVALELQPLQPADVADYLRRPLTEPAPLAWQSLSTTLTNHPDSTITQALVNPLTVSLLRDTYHPTDPVDELLDATRFPHPIDITNHLLDHAVTAAYTPRPGQPPPRYTAQTAQRSLTFVAQHLRDGNIRDLAWWEIPNWIPRKSNALIAALLNSIVFGLVGYVLGDRVSGLLGGLAGGLVSGLSGAFRTSEKPSRFAWFKRAVVPWGTVTTVALVGGLGGGILVGLTAGLVFGPMAGVKVGLTAGLVFGPVVGLMAAMDSGDPSKVAHPSDLWRADLVFKLALGPTIMLGIVVAAAVAGELAGRPVERLGFGLVIGLVMGLALGLVVSTAWHVAISQIYLAIRYRTPFRFGHFLKDANTRHLLRTVGPIYQFRHATLQDRLAPPHPHQ